MKRILLFLLLAFPASPAITYFNSANTPVDTGGDTADPMAVTPPASMASGDLVFMIGATKASGATFAISADGGQSWSALTRCSGNSSAAQVFWARFNGTWSANPSINFTGQATYNSVIMHVFRPTDSAKLWGVDGTIDCASYSAPTTPFTVTITGRTTGQPSTVTMASWVSQDDNTWGSLSGSGWAVTGLAQYRNTAGTDGSLTFAHNIQTTTATLANVSKNQLTLGGVAGITALVTFYEFDAPASSGPRRGSLAQMGVGR